MSNGEQSNHGGPDLKNGAGAQGKEHRGRGRERRRAGEGNLPINGVTHHDRHRPEITPCGATSRAGQVQSCRAACWARRRPFEVKQGQVKILWPWNGRSRRELLHRVPCDSPGPLSVGFTREYVALKPMKGGWISGSSPRAIILLLLPPPPFKSPSADPSLPPLAQPQSLISLPCCK